MNPTLVAKYKSEEKQRFLSASQGRVIMVKRAPWANLPMAFGYMQMSQWPGPFIVRSHVNPELNETFLDLDELLEKWIGD